MLSFHEQALSDLLAEQQSGIIVMAKGLRVDRIQSFLIRQASRGNHHAQTKPTTDANGVITVDDDGMDKPPARGRVVFIINVPKHTQMALLESLDRDELQERPDILVGDLNAAHLPRIVNNEIPPQERYL